jgi:acetyltransferase-like isoleucine patch superfamily enzyme
MTVSLVPMEPTINPLTGCPQPPRLSDRSLPRKLASALRDGVISAKGWYLRKILHMDIHPDCRFSLKAHFDTTHPAGIHVGAGTYIAFHAVVLSHDMCRLLHVHTRIGKNCFIGAHAIVLPGVTIGDECIIGSGTVVTRDVPSRSICVGNPGKVIKSGIRTREYGILLDIYEAVRSVEEAEDALK